MGVGRRRSRRRSRRSTTCGSSSRQVEPRSGCPRPCRGQSACSGTRTATQPRPHAHLQPCVQIGRVEGALAWLVDLQLPLRSFVQSSRVWRWATRAACRATLRRAEALCLPARAGGGAPACCTSAPGRLPLWFALVGVSPSSPEQRRPHTSISLAPEPPGHTTTLPTSRACTQHNASSSMRWTHLHGCHLVHNAVAVLPCNEDPPHAGLGADAQLWRQVAAARLGGRQVCSAASARGCRWSTADPTNVSGNKCVPCAVGSLCCAPACWVGQL